MKDTTRSPKGSPASDLFAFLRRLHKSLTKDTYNLSMGYQWGHPCQGRHGSAESGWYFTIADEEPLFEATLPAMLKRLRRVLKSEAAECDGDHDCYRSADQKLQRALNALSGKANVQDHAP